MIQTSIHNLLNLSKNRLINLNRKLLERGKRKRSTSKKIIAKYQEGERDFRHLLIVNQSFANADLSGSNFIGTDFQGCEFDKAILKGAKFDKAIFRFSIWQIINISINGTANRNNATFSWTEILFDSVFLVTRITPLAIILVIIASILLSPIVLTNSNFISWIVVLSIRFLVFSFIVLILRNFLIFNQKNLLESFCSGFRSADLYASSFKDSILNNCDFSCANLSYSSFIRSSIKNSNFKACDISQVDFFAAFINQACEFSVDSKLIQLCVTRNGGRMNLRDMKISNFKLDKVILNGADLTGSDLNNCNLRFGSFIGAKMEKCILTGSDLTGSNFQNAFLLDAEMVASKFINSSLNNALLPGSKALGTIFKRTDLTGSCIANWQINSETTFQDITCDYIYLDYFYRKGVPISAKRVPTDEIFQDHEFEDIMSQYFNLAEIVFRKNFPGQVNSGVDDPERSSLSNKIIDLHGAIPTGIDPGTFSRLQLSQAISRLPYAQFSRLEMTLEVPLENRAGSSANGGERSAKLFEWAESPIGCGIEKIKSCLAYIMKNP